MKAATMTWLNEARADLREVKNDFTNAGSMTGGNCERLFKVYEKAIKAPIVERFGSVPGGFQTHELCTLCHSCRLWPMLNPRLKSAITDMAPFYPVYPSESAHRTVVLSSSFSEWQNRIAVAGVLIEHIEKNIICDSAAFGKLTF